MDENNREYKNEDITVYWRPGRCIHAATCYRELIAVFNPARRPWVNMSGAGTDEIIDIVKRCPTMALSYTWNNGTASDKPPEGRKEGKEGSGVEPVSIEVLPGGPLLVEGNMNITGLDGNPLENNGMVFFCRCGHSRNMPFCDGSHRDHDFDK